jgi:hypothetical protein
MTVNTRPPHKARPATLSAADGRNHVRAEGAIPTIAEARRRLAAAGPDPWVTPAALEAMGQAEEAAGGWLVGPAVCRPRDAE